MSSLITQTEQTFLEWEIWVAVPFFGGEKWTQQFDI